MYNIWIILIIIFFIYVTCFCVQKELFDQKDIIDVQKKTSGTKYNIVEVNRAIQAIRNHQLEKEKVNIEITKIISIINAPGKMELKLFMYNPLRNVLKGYTAIVGIPISTKKEANVISLISFSDEETDGITSEKYEKFNMYQTVDMKRNDFT